MNLSNLFKRKEEPNYAELLLKEKDTQITHLKEQLSETQKQLFALQDSVLISRGQIATQSENKQQTTKTEQIVNRRAPGENLAIESEIDRLKDVLMYRPNDLEEEINNLLAVNSPRNKEIVRLFYERYIAASSIESENNDGVTIMTN